jgi:hypothetical protein
MTFSSSTTDSGLKHIYRSCSPDNDRERARSESHKLLRLFAVNGLFGVMMGVVMAILLITLDIHGLGGLSWQDPEGMIAIALLGSGFAITFGGAAIATAIMLIDTDEDHTVLFHNPHGFFISPPASPDNKLGDAA